MAKFIEYPNKFKCMQCGQDIPWLIPVKDEPEVEQIPPVFMYKPPRFKCPKCGQEGTFMTLEGKKNVKNNKEK